MEHSESIENRPYETAPCGCKVYGNWFDGATHYEPWVDEHQCDSSCQNQTNATEE